MYLKKRLGIVGDNYRHAIRLSLVTYFEDNVDMKTMYTFHNFNDAVHTFTLINEHVIDYVYEIDIGFR